MDRAIRAKRNDQLRWTRAGCTPSFPAATQVPPILSIGSGDDKGAVSKRGPRSRKATFWASWPRERRNVFHNNNDLQEGFRRTGATPELHVPAGILAAESEIRRLLSCVKGDGERHERASLCRLGVATMRPNISTTPAEDAKEEIRVALFSREEMTDIPVELHHAISSNRPNRMPSFRCWLTWT